MFFNKRINVCLPVIVWGDIFFDLFENNFLKLINEEFKNKKALIEKYNISLDIWTQKSKKKQLKINNIKIRFFEIDKYINENNKYEIIKKIQNNFLNFYNKIDKVFFLYPDFIWKKGSLINLLKINKKIVNIYCPQIIKENYPGKEGLVENFESFLAKNLHPIVTNTIINNNLKSFFTAACNLYKLPQNAYLFKNYHLHPVLFNNPNFQNINFRISLDEDFFHKYILLNKINYNDIYYQKNSKKICFASLETINNHTETLGLKKNSKNIARWFSNNCSIPHHYNSLNTYLLNGSKKSYFNEKKKFNTFFNKIYQYINTSIINISNTKSNIISRLDRRLFQKNL
jgi:hypothetical protein